MARLITPTILDKYAWLKKAPVKGGWKEKAQTDLYNALHRIKVPQEEFPEWLTAGIEFEKVLCRAVDNDSINKGSKVFEQCREYLAGCKFQTKTKRFIEIDGEEYLLFGYIDACKANTIIDIKTTSNYRGKQHYLNGWQHPIYLYCERAANFVYLVVEITYADGKLTLQESNIVEYSETSLHVLRDRIQDGIRDFMGYLDFDEELKDAYLHTFNRYG